MNFDGQFIAAVECSIFLDDRSIMQQKIGVYSVWAATLEIATEPWKPYDECAFPIGSDPLILFGRRSLLKDLIISLSPPHFFLPSSMPVASIWTVVVWIGSLFVSLWKILDCCYLHELFFMHHRLNYWWKGVENYCAPSFIENVRNWRTVGSLVHTLISPWFIYLTGYSLSSLKLALASVAISFQDEMIFVGNYSPSVEPILSRDQIDLICYWLEHTYIFRLYWLTHYANYAHSSSVPLFKGPFATIHCHSSLGKREHGIYLSYVSEDPVCRKPQCATFSCTLDHQSAAIRTDRRKALLRPSTVGTLMMIWKLELNQPDPRRMSN